MHLGFLLEFWGGPFSWTQHPGTQSLVWDEHISIDGLGLPLPGLFVTVPESLLFQAQASRLGLKSHLLATSGSHLCPSPALGWTGRVHSVAHPSGLSRPLRLCSECSRTRTLSALL